MPKLTALVLVVFISLKAHSQNLSVTGSVNDTIQNKGVQNAVVALLSPKDSVLYKFTRTDANGKYSFQDIRPGNYVVMTTHPYFADVIFNLDIKDPQTTVPAIALTSKSKLLAEVIVKSGSPIKIKGDTTVYTADSFKVRPGANVEELLRKLPGIQVDKDGKITAMGEQVKKVLVDGEEFFGDDPGIATKNLRADIVKEVEVFDKKSDQATFTGIDDGVKDKTINLKLKDNAKKGYFGKVEGGTDFKNYYNNSAMVNAFKGKRKLAAYGIMSNTGKTNLDWNDAQNYSGGIDGLTTELMDGGGMMMMFDGGGDGDSYYNGRGGIPTNWNGGLHYSNKFNDGKQSLNSGYKFSKINSPSGQSTFTTNFVGDSSYFSKAITEGYSSKIKHNLNLTFEATLDSANSLKLTAKGNLNNTKANSTYTLESLSPKSLLINTSDRRSNSETDNSSLNSTLLWKHKFKKIARTLTVNLNYNYSNSDVNGFLYSDNDYYDNGIFARNDLIDQKNKKNNNTQSLTTNMTYTEPLAKDFFMSFTYAYSTSTNINDRFSYSKDANNMYTKLIDSLSNSYLFKQVTNKPGISFRLVKKKYNYSAGLNVSTNHFIQDNRTKTIKRDYNFTNFFPNASFYMKLKNYGGIRLNYNGSSRAPSLDQLQPIVDNTDPLNQYVGNPDLKQSFTHSLNANYNFYNVLKERGFWSGVYGSFTQNAFVNSTTIDNSGKSIYKTVNVNGNYYFNLYSNYNFKWKKPNINISFGPNASLSRNNSFINSQKATNDNRSYGFSTGINKDKDKKYNIGVNYNISWVKTTNSVNTSASAKYWQMGVNANAEVTLPFKFRLGSDVNFTAKQKDPRFPANNNYTLWNASLRRPILKDVLEASVSVNDLLNQNRGYDRTFTDYRYTESYYTTLKRYWLLTVTWNFSKNGKPTSGF